MQKENESSHLQSTGTRALVEEETCNDREGFFFLKDIEWSFLWHKILMDFVIDNMQHIVSENYKPLSYRGHRPLNMPNRSSYRGYYQNSVYPLEYLMDLLKQLQHHTSKETCKKRIDIHTIREFVLSIFMLIQNMSENTFAAY